MAKIRRGKFWYCSLEMKKKFGMRPLATASQWMFMVDSGWLVLFPDGLWMVAVISWRALDGCCSFLMGPGWLWLFLGGLWIEWDSLFNGGSGKGSRAGGTGRGYVGLACD